jgi:hypothetical protein
MERAIPRKNRLIYVDPDISFVGYVRTTDGKLSPKRDNSLPRDKE